MNQKFYRPPKVFNPPKEKKSFKLPANSARVVLLIIILLIIVYGLFYSPLFKIRHVEIIGEGPVQALDSVKKFSNQNIFIAKTDSAEGEIIKNYPEVLSINIYRGLPDKLRVKFNQRVPKAVWQTQSQFYAVDSEGIVFRQYHLDETLPLIIDSNNLNVSIMDKVSHANFVDFIKRAQFELKQNGFTIDNFEVGETTFQVTAVSSDKIRILLDTIRPLSDQIDALKYFKNQNLPYGDHIDLRVEGWVYYK